MIKIFHISDLHLESESPSFEKLRIIRALTEDLERKCTDESILIFSGDLIDKGGSLFSSDENPFVHFETKFIEPILEKVPKLKGRIFIVPGNHDVVRSKIDPITEIGLKTQLVDVKTLEGFIQQNRINSKHLERLSDYKNWEMQFYKKYNCIESSNFENTFKIKLGIDTVGITCLNSSWLCKDDSDKENILLGKNQIENSLSLIQDCNVKLVVSHHPIEFFKEFDRDSIKVPIYKNYDVFFTGHVHELASSYTQDLLGNIFISIANSTIGDFPSQRRYVNGYTILDFYPGDKIVTNYRKYIESHSKFVPNTDIGTEDGSKVFKILKDESLESFESNIQIIDSIESRHCEKLNEHIIMASSNTNVTCSIESLFVEPTITNSPQGNLKEENLTRYTIDSILNSNENFLIYGMKESGKTLLIDKMFIETVKRFNHFNKIPILLKYSDFKKGEILKVIREFTGVSSSEINNFLRSNSVVIFIDDIHFLDRGESQIQKLKEFIRTFSNVQIIAISTLALENVLPIDYLEHNEVFNFNLAFIQNFSSSEIKQLIQKWFLGKDVDVQENMEKLIKSFVDFGLPKTPLSVTLFLWIFEKQEQRPINNSVLVELFIENLLEKTNQENIYSETFDFTNKKRLLSFVAKFMLDNGDGDSSYSVDYVELLTFFKNYLITRFHGQPQKVLDDFVSRGILTFEEDNLIRFKSAFFFHYFIAIHFDYAPSFKQYVFTGENYLNFIEEIAYYTGLKRDDLGILNFTQDKLNVAFRGMNIDLLQSADKIDVVLERKNKTPIAFQIDESKAENKLSETELDELYDTSLSSIPVQKNIESKNTIHMDTKKSLDKILKLASNVLKNSEDVDDYEAKKAAYQNTLLSSISFLMLYRDGLIEHYLKYKAKPDNFPKNIDFNLFIRVLPLIHQVVIFEWLGSQKLRPVIVDKIEKDRTNLNISEFERFLSVFLYADIKGGDYPKVIEDFSKSINCKYLKDLTFLKIMSYYHLRNNGRELDLKYLQLMARIKEDLGQLDRKNKGKFLREHEEKKRKDGL